MTPDLGSRPIADITPAELLSCLRKVEAKGNRETSRRMRSLAGRIFRYAVATSRATSDPAAFLRGALTAPIVSHHSAILDPLVLGELLRKIDTYPGGPLTRLALQLTPHVYARPGMLRQAEWAEIDLEKGVWSLSEGRMKMRRAHAIPLSRQAIAILEEAFELTAGRQYVFSTTRNRPMSENTVNNALRRLGYGSHQVTAHGFRATASSMLNESGRWSVDAIERSLAHKDASVRGIYHRGAHWAERVAMAQWWSDYLDELRAKSA
jgi:integrase